MPVVPQANVTIEPRVGKQHTLADGVTVKAVASAQAHASYSIPQDLHLDEVLLFWKDFESGDKGWLRLIHPSSQGSPAVDPSGTSVDVGALSPYYDPANGAQALEFWDGDDLEEVIPIASISGNIVTLASAPVGTYTTSTKIKSRFQSFNPIRGTKGLDGAFYLLGNGTHALGAPNEQTAIISAGLLLYVGILAVAGGTERSFATNFIFREVDA